MTDDEVLVKSFENILKEIKEEKADAGERNELNSEIAESYDEAIERLERIVPKIKCTDDIFVLDDEQDYYFAIDSLENYFENYVVDGRDEQKKAEGYAELEALGRVLAEFYEDDDEEEDSESDE